MSVFSVIALFLTVAALASYLNYRYVRLPSAIGLMVIGLLMSLGLIGLSALGVEVESAARGILSKVDFGETLMKGMLSFLLFAGALKINLTDLAQQKMVVGILATVGVVMTTLIVGTGMYFALPLVGLSLPFIYCLIFGSLIAPTDPVAVLSILKSVKVPKSIETKIAGESLFNDGVGIVVFTMLVGVVVSGESISASGMGLLFLQEAVGGVLLGLVLGAVAFYLLRGVNDHNVEVLLTLALVCGGYALASGIHTSGPIAIVVAGLLIGNYGRLLAMSDATRDHLDKFWELIDEILNAILFVWVGMEILVLSFSVPYLLAGLIAIPLTLAARWGSVWSVVTSLKLFRSFSDNAILILTWGGLRGGISIALALSLAPGDTRDLIVSVTYVVVVFSILVQGLTIKRLMTSGPSS